MGAGDGSKLTHVDLFSGIGCLALAARANGIQTVQFVEIDKRCRQFLSEAWPEVPCHDDIKTFYWTGEPVWLLSGSPPCQPISCAGKRRGKADDRWLWGEAVRVLAEVRPTWAVFENPRGLATMGLDGVLSDLEGAGYEVGALDIPACAVNAPHRRARLWIVCRRVGEPNGDGPERAALPSSGGGPIRPAGRSGGLAYAASDDFTDVSQPSPSEAGTGGPGEPDGSRGVQTGVDAFDGDMADSEGAGTSAAQLAGCGDVHRGDGQWDDYLWTACADGKVRRTPNSTLMLVDGRTVDLLDILAEEGWPHRSILGALGNSVVPEIPKRIIQAMIQADRIDG